MRRIFNGFSLLLTAVFLSACELPQPPQGIITPTLFVTQTETASTATALPSATTAATITPSPLPQLESPSPTFTLGPPTETFTASPTPGPVAYVIQPGDDLLGIIYQPPFFYRDTQVFDEILRLNPNIISINILPPPGSTILIPMPTATYTPAGYEQTLAIATPIPQFDARELEQLQYTVEEGDTILSVAINNATTLGVLATLNPELSFFGCDYEIPSGGPDCNPLLVIGQQLQVPALTATPTLSPTFSGSETPTSTPTYPPPDVVFPQQNASASATTFQLSWLSVGILQPQEVYIVQVEDTTSGATFTDVTRNTSYELPDSLIPTDGQSHTMRWRVSVALPAEDGSSYRIVSGDAPWRTFQWSSR